MRRWLGALPLTLLFIGCVPSGGGSGGGGSGGDQPPADGGSGDACVPSCADRACGDDGCGGSCGDCAEDQICSGTGVCLGVPASCGDEVCSAADGETCETCPADCGACCGDGVCTAEHGEHCGTCPADCGCPEGEACDAGRGICEAECVPACDGRDCGDDGCGGACGDCAEGEVCGGDGTCAPPPETCGDDACDDGEDCANCAADCGCEAGEDCEAGACVEAARCGDGACDPGEDCGSCAADCACEQGLDCVRGECVCVPDCAGAECGDDGCGGVCGACPDGAACAGGQCVVGCDDDCGALWAGSCTDDGFGLRLCTPDPERPGCTTPSRRIPCGEGRACVGGACGGQCVQPEVLLLIDRSSSMIGERWQFTRQTLLDTVGDRQGQARLGLRTFPGTGDGCAAGNITAPAFGALRTFERMPEPAEVAQTPIAAAFDGVEVVFGDPDEGETIILLTDGDETCDEELAAVQRVEALRRRGIRTFAVGISRQANGELLAAIAEAGGTARAGGPPYYVVDDAAQLGAALADIFVRLEACVCAEGETRCAAGNAQVCAPDGLSFEVTERCELGCNAEVGACFGVCDPGEEGLLCDGDSATVCAPEGDGYVVVERCRFGCQDGVGCNPVCRPGSRLCQGDVSTQCGPDGGGFEPVENCGGPCDAATGLCGGGLCAPGTDFRCGAEGLEVCDFQGADFDLLEVCDCDPQVAQCRGQAVDGALRLVGDSGDAGRLEVYHNGQWGTVCDDSFGAADERVACRQLGYPDRSTQFDANGAGNIWMDDVACVGGERRLADCPFPGWGAHNCGHPEDVGLSCLVPAPGEAYCVGPAESWRYLPGGVVRRAQCAGECLPETGLCDGEMPPVEGVALPPDECYAHHGGCGDWNDCGDAEGCAELACSEFGLGPAVAWRETATCVLGGQTCRPYSPDRNAFDANFGGCQLPAACEVVCAPF